MVSGAGSERMALTEERMAVRVFGGRAWRDVGEALGRYTARLDLANGLGQWTESPDHQEPVDNQNLIYGPLRTLRLRLGDMLVEP